MRVTSLIAGIQIFTLTHVLLLDPVRTYGFGGIFNQLNARVNLKIQPGTSYYLNEKLFLQKKTISTECYGKVHEANPSKIEDDGYTTRFGKVRGKFKSSVKAAVKRVFRGKPKPGTLILVRHGETVWNFNSTFTGWCDIDLSQRGRREMEHAGRLLLERGYDIDVTYTSRLKRAIRSSWILLQELNQIYRPVYKSYRLNERMYGAFEGLSKPLLAQGLGKEAIQAYRLELDSRPPAMTSTHPHWHKNERKYADLDPWDIPVTESLQDTMDRTLPLWHTRIKPELELGNNVMVVGHGHSLRGLVRHIDQLSPEQIQAVGIPNGIPLVSSEKLSNNLRILQ
jgi:2,3-bisphosphoglycerate-dependent phosphoglycerate mutase